MHKNSTQCHNLPLNTKNCSHFFILSMFDLGTLVRAINTTITPWSNNRRRDFHACLMASGTWQKVPGGPGGNTAPLISVHQLTAACRRLGFSVSYTNLNPRFPSMSDLKPDQRNKHPLYKTSMCDRKRCPFRSSSQCWFAHSEPELRDKNKIPPQAWHAFRFELLLFDSPAAPQKGGIPMRRFEGVAIEATSGRAKEMVARKCLEFLQDRGLCPVAPTTADVDEEMTVNDEAELLLHCQEVLSNDAGIQSKAKLAFFECVFPVLGSKVFGEGAVLRHLRHGVKSKYGSFKTFVEKNYDLVGGVGRMVSVGDMAGVLSGVGSVGSSESGVETTATHYVPCPKCMSIITVTLPVTVVCACPECPECGFVVHHGGDHGEFSLAAKDGDGADDEEDASLKSAAEGVTGSEGNIGGEAACADTIIQALRMQVRQLSETVAEQRSQLDAIVGIVWRS